MMFSTVLHPQPSMIHAYVFFNTVALLFLASLPPLHEWTNTLYQYYT